MCVLVKCDKNGNISHYPQVEMLWQNSKELTWEIVMDEQKQAQVSVARCKCDYCKLTEPREEECVLCSAESGLFVFHRNKFFYLYVI